MAKDLKKQKKFSHKQVKRFQLEVYSPNKKTRYTCPSCGHKDSFVRFVDVTTGEYVGEDFGRCNREIKCGYFKSPKGSNVGDKELYVSVSKVKNEYIENDYISLINPKYIIKTTTGIDNLTSFLLSIFDPKIVLEIKNRYRVGNDNNIWIGGTVFWQIDKDFDVRTGKIMLYDKKTGKRIKKPFNHITWMHTTNKNNKFGSNSDFCLTQCFFGEHLLTEYPEIDEYHVVESEKTALLCSLSKPETLWLATGGLQNINRERLLPFRNKKLIFYPDKGKAYKEWERKLEPFKGEFNIKLSQAVEKLNTLEEGDDLGDYIILKHKK